MRVTKNAVSVARIRHRRHTRTETGTGNVTYGSNTTGMSTFGTGSTTTFTITYPEWDEEPKVISHVHAWQWIHRLYLRAADAA